MDGAVRAPVEAGCARQDTGTGPAMQIGAPEIIVLLLLLLYLAALVVTGMKGRWVLFVLGLLFGIFAFVGALLPAKPGSTWERRQARKRLAS